MKSMFKKVTLLVGFAALASSALGSDTFDAKKALHDIFLIKREMLGAAEMAGKAPDDKLIADMMKESAAARLKGCDPSKFEDHQLGYLGWLYLLVEDYPLAEKLANESLSKNIDLDVILTSTLCYIKAAGAQGKTKEAMERLKAVSALDALEPDMASNFMGEIIISVYPELKSTDPKGTLAVATAFRERFPVKPEFTEDQVRFRNDVLQRLVVGAAQTLGAAGSKEEALALLDKELGGKTTDEQGRFLDLYIIRNQIAIADKPAIPIVPTKTIGAFEGWNALKGKVVVLGFMHHTPSPTEGALAELAAVSKEFKSKGVAVLGLNKFYGFFNGQKNLTEEQEAEKVKEWMKGTPIGWPVLFANKAYTDYVVRGLPMIIVIDKKGNVRHFINGYAPTHFEAELRKQVESLLAE